MRTHVEFVSDAFPGYGDEVSGETINPGIWGRRLAEFLTARLQEYGVAAGKPYAEDWGYAIPIKNERFPLFIGCSNQLEPDGNRFLCFVDPCKPEIRQWFFKKVRTVEDVTRIADALDRILREHPDVRELRWWSEDEIFG